MAVYRVIRLFSKKRKDNEHEVDSTKAGKALIAGGIAGNTVGGLVYSKSSLSGKTTSEEVASKLKELAKIVHDNHLTLTTMLVVGEAIDNRQGLSELYNKQFTHLFRQGEA